MKSLVEFILEKQGIFNGCEDIANELLKIIINKTKTMKQNGFEFSFDASKYNPIFRNDIIVNVKYKNRKDGSPRIEANTSFDEEQLTKYAVGSLLLSQEDIDDLMRKPYKIDLKLDKFEIDLYDLKGILMHELTHFYTAIIFYNRDENYFGKKYYKPEDWENDSEYLLYFIQKDEVNSWVTEMKPELDRIKTKGFTDVFNELKDKDPFKRIIEFRDKFNKNNWRIDFNKIGLGEYPNLYLEHFDNKKITDIEIYNKTQDLVNKAYNQLYRTVVKMCYEYKGDKDFIYDEFDEEIFKPFSYLPEIRKYKRY